MILFLQRKNTIFSMSEVIRGGGGFVATNSLLMRASLLDEQPDFLKNVVWIILFRCMGR